MQFSFSPDQLDLAAGLRDANDTGYSTALATLPFAGSNALARTFSGLPAGNNVGYPNGRTFGEMLQRLSNTIVWGQHDTTCGGRGGWYYTFSNNSCTTSDGSTVGWDVLALLDAQAAGSVVPAFVKSEYQNFARIAHTNTDGSFDYSADSCDGCFGWSNIAKAGVGLEGTFWVGLGPGLHDDYIASVWNTGGTGGSCGTQNLGCAYDMFNAFKGLKLHGIATLPGIGVPAGPGYPANDWYAAYVNWLVTNQVSPTSTTGGAWSTMQFSCCWTDAGASVMQSAIAELILSPVALIQPDPTLFATIGLGPTTAVNRPGTAHTVIATALSSSKSPIPGVTVDFDVLTGPNAGQSGQAVTDANGQASFTYTDTSVAPWPKTDTIQASIGVNGSNVVSKVWVLRCDANSSNSVNNADITIIRNANGQAASGPYDPRDGNADGVINVADQRYCQTRFVAAP